MDTLHTLSITTQERQMILNALDVRRSEWQTRRDEHDRLEDRHAAQLANEQATLYANLAEKVRAT